jgi:ribosomal protein S18 acetylase RimI-like enzyme
MNDVTTCAPAFARRLLDNHLSFSRLHRGSVERTRAAIEIRSSSPVYTCALLGEVIEPERVLDRFSSVRLLPSSGPWHSQLTARGYLERERLLYMHLPEPRAASQRWGKNPEMDVRIVDSVELMATFTRVQAEGFLCARESLGEELAFLEKANAPNLNHPDQCFLIGYLAGRAVGVTLAVLDGETAGIYAVTTLPEFRRQGVSTSLLARAVEHAMAAGCSTVTLQVFARTAAEALYKRLGFLVAFESPVLERPELP